MVNVSSLSALNKRCSHNKSFTLEINVKLTEKMANRKLYDSFSLFTRRMCKVVQNQSVNASEGDSEKT